MSGRTGKLTGEELARRGPRMVLGEVYFCGRPSSRRKAFVIFREGQEPFKPGNYRIIEWSKSFTLRYLLKLAKYN